MKRLGDLYAPQRSIGIGALVLHPGGGVYMFSKVGDAESQDRLVCLRGVGEGSQSANYGVPVADLRRLTRDEARDICGSYSFAAYRVVKSVTLGGDVIVGETLDEVFSERQTVGVGDFVAGDYSKRPYLLSEVRSGCVQATFLDNGEPLFDAVSVDATSALTATELRLILGPAWNDFQLMTRSEALAA